MRSKLSQHQGRKMKNAPSFFEVDKDYKLPFGSRIELPVVGDNSTIVTNIECLVEDDTLESSIYYHGYISEQNSEKILSNSQIPNPFLIRRNADFINSNYVLSYRKSSKCYHIDLKEQLGKTILFGDRVFPNLEIFESFVMKDMKYNGIESHSLVHKIEENDNLVIDEQIPLFESLIYNIIYIFDIKYTVCLLDSKPCFKIIDNTRMREKRKLPYFSSLILFTRLKHTNILKVLGYTQSPFLSSNFILTCHFSPIEMFLDLLKLQHQFSLGILIGNQVKCIASALDYLSNDDIYIPDLHIPNLGYDENLKEIIIADLSSAWHPDITESQFDFILDKADVAFLPHEIFFKREVPFRSTMRNILLAMYQLYENDLLWRPYIQKGETRSDFTERMLKCYTAKRPKESNTPVVKHPEKPERMYDEMHISLQEALIKFDWYAINHDYGETDTFYDLVTAILS